MTSNGIGVLYIPQKIWIEPHHDEDSTTCCDVLVQMEDGNIYTAMFVTLPYLLRQMELSFAVTSQLPDAMPVRYAALEVPHVFVEELSRDVIEDTIDNLIALEVFGSIFTQITEDPEDGTTPRTSTTGNGKLATQEVAAVVISDVLVVEG